MSQKVDVGSAHIVGVGVCANPWGGAPAQLGAGDALEVNACNINPGVALIANEGKYGASYRRPGSAGNRTPSVESIDFDVYYRDSAAWRIVGHGFGATAVTALGGGAHRHDLVLGNVEDVRGDTLTLADPGPVDVRELPQWKVGDITVSVSEGQQRLKCVAKGPAFDLNRNVGAPSPAAVVAATTPVNGALAFVQLTHPGALTVTVADGDASISEYELAFVGLDANGEPLTYTYKRTTHGLVHTTPAFSALTSITGAALAGTATGDTVLVEAAVVPVVTVANGVLTLGAQPVNPTPVQFTLVDADSSVMAVTITYVYLNRQGRQVTDVFTLANATAGGGQKTWITSDYVLQQLAATVSGLTGGAAADKLRANVTNGINNAATAAALTTAADRQEVLFTDLKAWIKPQADAADFTSADEAWLSGLEFGIAKSLDARVTSRFGNRIEEPTLGGGGWPSVSVKFSFSAKTQRNRKFEQYSDGKTVLRVKVVATGPVIAGTAIAQTLTLWFNGVQVEGNANWSDAGVMALEVSGTANNVVTVPTNYPAGHNRAVKGELVNGQATPLF